MKKVEAIIRHFKLEDVTQALLKLNIPGLSVEEGRGSVSRRAAESGGESAEFLPKIKLELVVAAEQVRAIVETIQRTARTGQAGDGKVLVSDVEQVIRIRTGESLNSPLAATA